MKTVYVIMEENGPYNWQRANHTSGPHYDEKTWFQDEYETKQQAVSDIADYLIEHKYSSRGFFVMEVYTDD